MFICVYSYIKILCLRAPSFSLLIASGSVEKLTSEINEASNGFYSFYMGRD